MFWVQPPAGSPSHFSPDGPGSDGRLFPLPTSKGTFSVERSPINPPPFAGHSLTSNGDPIFLGISIFGSRNVLRESQELFPEWRGKFHSVNRVPQFTPRVIFHTRTKTSRGATGAVNASPSPRTVLLTMFNQY